MSGFAVLCGLLLSDWPSKHVASSLRLQGVTSRGWEQRTQTLDHYLSSCPLRAPGGRDLGIHGISASLRRQQPGLQDIKRWNQCFKGSGKVSGGKSWIAIESVKMRSWQAFNY